MRLQGLVQLSVWMLLATLAAGCATHQALRDQPLAGPAPVAGAVPAPAAVANALLPPLRADMPRLPGTRAEGRFDLTVDDVPAREVFMSLVAGTEYGMVVHPYVSGSITLNLKDVTVADALGAIRETFGYEYREEDRRIYVLPAGLQTRIYAAGDVMDRRTAGASSAPPGNVARPAFWEELERSLRDLVGTTEGRNVVTNARSGVIAVRAMPAELRAVETYLDALRFSTERQIIIEARIAEVTLAAGGRSAVNWPAPAARAEPGGRILQTGDFEQTLAFLQTQGQVRLLASPRLMVANNRKAVVRVGTDENRVSQIQAVPLVDSASRVQMGVSFAPTLAPHFAGVSLEITPIYSDQGAITLHVHPVFSRVDDGLLRFNFGGAGEQELRIAKTSISETDTVVRVRDGSIVAISGLTPVAASDPGRAQEWVILVKATAVPGVWQGRVELGDRPDFGGIGAGQEGMVQTR